MDCHIYSVFGFLGGLYPVQFVVIYGLGPFHQKFRFGNTCRDVLEAKCIDETITDALIYDKFHVEVYFFLRIAVAIQFVNDLFVADGTEDGKRTKFINVVVDRRHTDGPHIG